MRIYYEATNPKEEMQRDVIRKYIPKVKLGMAFFPKELHVVPTTWAKTQGEVVYISEHDRGGHFPAIERPETIVEDLRKMFGKGGGAYAVVSGRNGYSKVSARL